MVNFLPFDINDEDSVADILSHIDNAIQYGEGQEPKEPKVTYSVKYNPVFNIFLHVGV
jgi:hypothetical protein